MSLCATCPFGPSPKAPYKHMDVLAMSAYLAYNRTHPCHSQDTIGDCQGHKRWLAGDDSRTAEDLRTLFNCLHIARTLHAKST